MIIVDVETTGLNPLKNSIVSIGAVDFENPANFFYEECRIWKGAQISEEALHINGFTRAQVQDPRRKSLEDLMKAFLAWATNASDPTLAGANVYFDLSFLKVSAQRYTLEWIFSYRTIELQSLYYVHVLKRTIQAAEKFSRPERSTDKILKYVGLPEEPKPHIGIVGAKMEAEAFSRLISGKGLLPEYQQYPIPPYLASL